jgi:hypothetical protein
MRTVCFLLLLTAGFAVQRFANAQGSLATDNEIYAGYCLGVIAAQPAMMEKIDPNWRADADPGAMRQGNQQIESHRRHFVGYLMSRGIYTSPNRGDVLLGVMIAQRRGGRTGLGRSRLM